MPENIPKYIIVHHTGGTDKDPLADTSHHTREIVEQYHLSLGWKGIGYHWFIEKNGRVVRGRAEELEGAHTKGFNKSSIGICLAGNFDLTIPTEAQTNALRLLLADVRTRYKIPLENIVPHREFATKTCYGKRLADDWARKLLEPENINEEMAKKLLGMKIMIDEMIELNGRNI